MPAPIAIVDAGVDYLTCTFNDEADHTRLQARIHRTHREEQREGNKVSEWRLSGYQGQRVGGLEWGYRHDGAIVRLSGFSAQQYWRRFGKLASNCSRIDLQVTCIYEEEWAKTIARHWSQMKRHYAKRKGRPEPKVIRGPHGPETIYSGRRVSDVFLRLYHRGSRPGFAKCQGHVRYELELKGVLSRIALSELARSQSAEELQDALVRGHFANRGCCLEWSNKDMSRIRGPMKSSDVDRRLAWFRKAVRPSIQFIIEAGRGDEIADALGWPMMAHVDQAEEEQ